MKLDARTSSELWEDLANDISLHTPHPNPAVLKDTFQTGDRKLNVKKKVSILAVGEKKKWFLQIRNL